MIRDLSRFIRNLILIKDHLFDAASCKVNRPAVCPIPAASTPDGLLAICILISVSKTNTIAKSHFVFISIMCSRMSWTSEFYIAIMPNIISIPPAFDTIPLTDSVLTVSRAAGSSRSWSDPAAKLIDGGVDRPVALASGGHSQVSLGSGWVLEQLQTVNAINNVNICH